MGGNGSQGGVRGRFVEAVRQAAAASGRPACPGAADLPGASAMHAAAGADLSPRVVSAAVARTLGVPEAGDLLKRPPSAEFLDKVPIGFARRHGLLGLAGNNGVMPVVVSDLGDLDHLEVLSRFIGRRVSPLLAGPEEIAAAINAAYQQKTGQADLLIQDVDGRETLSDLAQLSGHDDLLDVEARAPVIRLVSRLLFEAVKQEASDVHIQPYEDKLVIRMRIDGVLFDLFEMRKGLQEEIVSRVKVMGKMNIAEKRLPQDGRTTVQVGDRVIDLRIASLPTSFGERVVIRLLDKSIRLYALRELGMDGEACRRFGGLINADHGIVLVTGPTGSGKSTTLYAALQEINSTESNVLTLEDPIEYQLEGISQTQINEKKGMTFAGGLRNILRQDPDIIMVGEIRDRETAVMAIQAALTGHLVFSTLHTNDAASAVTRLLELGIEPYLVASSVTAVLAQRLVRSVCSRCARPCPATPEQLRDLGGSARSDTGHMRKGEGCDACRKTGYRGRVGIFELLTMDEEIQRLIQARATAGEIKRSAVSRGMRTLVDDGLAKALAGVTTIEEVGRVTMQSTV